MVKLTKTNDQKYSYAKILILGESGTGKTHFLGTVPENEVLIINVVSESGLLTLKGKNIDVIDVNDYAEIIDAINWVKENGSKYNYIAIDSLSQWQKNLEVQSRLKGFDLWREVKTKTKEIVNKLKELPFHVICTSEIRIDKDEESGSLKYLPDMIGSIKNEITYMFDEVWYFDRAQVKPGEPIVYRCLTQAATKYPCKTRTNLEPVFVDPDMSKMINEMVGEIDKKKQKEDLKKAIGVKIENLSESEVVKNG